MNLETITTLIAICKSAVSGIRAIDQWAGSDLSERERELLIAAAEAGTFQIGRSDIDGTFVIGGIQPFFGNGPADTAQYLDAFESLCKRGLVRYTGDDIFSLNGNGFDQASKVALDGSQAGRR